MSLKFQFRYFANGKFTKLNSASFYVFRKLSMIAYIIEIQKSKFANIKFREFDQYEPSR